MPTEMTYQQLGLSGLTVSTIGVGCNSDIAEGLVRITAHPMLEHEGHGAAACGVDRLVDQARAADLKSAPH